MPEKKKSGGAKPARSRLLKIILGFAIVLLIVRLSLPYIALHYANKALAGMHGYHGHVEDIDIALLRGAYRLNNIFINKVDSNNQMQTAFFRSESIDLSVEWKALFHGSIAGELVFEKPMLRFTKDKTEPNQVKKDTTDFRIVLKKFMPLKINRFEVTHGILAYNDSSSSPPVSLEMTNTHILAQNLKSVYGKNEVLPATVDASAYLYKGEISFNMKLNPLADKPTFDLNTELKNTNLPELNEFFKAYGKFDVNRGNFGLYAEMAAKDNLFKGYVKPVITGLDVVGPEDRNDGFLHKLWESAVGAVGVVFRNQKKDQIATKVPIEGSFKNPDTDVLDAVVEVVVNAFIQALVPAIDNEINLNTVTAENIDNRNILQKIFSKKKKKGGK